MIKRKNIFLSIVCATALLSGMSAQAETGKTYESIVAEYGEKSDSYIETTKLKDAQLKMVFCNGDDAEVHTEVNIRREPAAEAEKEGTISSDAKIKVWGYVENGWSSVYVKTDDQNYFGFIKSDLLFNAVK